MTPALANMHVMVTRSVRGNMAWRREFEKTGVRVYELPTIKTVVCKDALAPFLDKLYQHDWLVFTSAAGARHFFEIQGTAEQRLSAPPAIAVVGEQTAAAVRVASSA